jgi:endonuclease YncB( thermonuclease family)
LLRRLITVVSAAAAVLAGTAVPAAAGTPCRPAAGSPVCQVWTGKVTWVPDGDTPQVVVAGTKTAQSIRVIGIQTMEQSVYSKVPAKRRGQCHALAATARVEALVKAGGGVVRMTAQYPSSRSETNPRPLRSIAVKIGGQWRDLGLDLIRNGLAIWLPSDREWAWNSAYRIASQQAAAERRGLFDTDACGYGPNQKARVSLDVNYDAPGIDADNLNGEWFRINNASGLPLPIGGWWVRDSALRRFTFPAGAVVPANGAIHVHVGRGARTATRYYWGQTLPVFGNPTGDYRAVGDGGYLFDPHGDLRAWKIYP